MKKGVIKKHISIAIVLLLALAFVAKFGGPSILRFYVENGIGSCEKIPFLCAIPEKEIANTEISKEYSSQLLPYNFPGMEIYLPKGFAVVKERIARIYYKKNRRLHSGPVIYLLDEEENFFVNLFPQVKKDGVKNDYEFISRVMYADIKNIRNLTDAFFVIMKSAFIPDLGGQGGIKMVKFSVLGKKGFINYNIGNKENYFDCNIINNQGAFFKLYIKDKGAKLDLNKVIAVISTVKKVN